MPQDESMLTHDAADQLAAAVGDPSAADVPPRVHLADRLARSDGTDPYPQQYIFSDAPHGAAIYSIIAPED